jgi:Glyoxalase/Bleomycin resistance protein/Dioxygenase superfamily
MTTRPSADGAMRSLHHVGYWVDDLDAALKRWGEDLGVGPFEVIGHLTFDSFVLFVDGQEHRDVVFDHSSAFAA